MLQTEVPLHRAGKGGGGGVKGKREHRAKRVQ